MIQVIIALLITSVSTASCGCNSITIYSEYDSWIDGTTSVSSCNDCISTAGCSTLRVYDRDFYDNQNYYSWMPVYTCPPCIANCIACNDDISCNQCYSGYVLDYNASNFINYLSGPAKCFLCSSITWCTSCSHGPVCNSCISGYTPNPLPRTLYIKNSQ